MTSQPRPRRKASNERYVPMSKYRARERATVMLVWVLVALAVLAAGLLILRLFF